MLDTDAMKRCLRSFTDPAAARRWAENMVVVAGRYGTEIADLVLRLGPRGVAAAEVIAHGDIDSATAAVRAIRESLKPAAGRAS